MTVIDTLISARWILPIEPHNQLLENHSLAITDGKITAILPTETAKQKLQAKQSINLNSHVLMPGLINSHAHSPMTLFRGLADDLPLMDWLQNHIWPAEQALSNEEFIADGTRLAILEMIRGGTTCFAENYFFHDVSAEVSANMGMRSIVGALIIQVPTAWANTEAEYLQKARSAIAQTTQNPLIHWAITPHSPYMVSDQALIECQQIAEEFNIPIHIHLHESQSEIEQSLEKHKKRPIAHFADLGILTKRMVGVHMVHVNDEDLNLYAEAHASVVHCPESNLKLGNGFAPITAMLKKNINVAVGTDGAASNNDLDMFAELRAAALIAKGQSQDPTAVPAATALAMATINGAKAFGLDKEIGSLQVNKAADMIAIDLDHYLTQPLYNPISHLAYAVNRLQVSDVWIAGKHILQKGEFADFDVEKMVNQAKRWCEKAKPFSSKASRAIDHADLNVSTHIS